MRVGRRGDFLHFPLVKTPISPADKPFKLLIVFCNLRSNDFLLFIFVAGFSFVVVDDFSLIMIESKKKFSN